MGAPTTPSGSRASRFSVLATADDLALADEVTLCEQPLAHLALCREAASWLRDLSASHSALFSAANQCRAIIKFHTDPGNCVTIGDDVVSALAAFKAAVAALETASAIEAASADEPTQIGSTEGESATRKGDAHD